MRTDFVLFGPLHLAIIALIPLAILVLSSIARRSQPAATRIRIALGLILAANGLVWYGFRIRQGDVGDRFYLVRSGRVRVRRSTDDGTEVLLGEIGTGEYFGEMALLSDAPRVATVEAIEATRVWSLDKGAFHDLLLGQFQLSGAITTEAERRSDRHLRLAGERAA